MNERIKELAEHASHQSPDGYPVTIPYSKDFVKKFAKLIVRECVDQCADNGSNDEWDKGVRWAANQIKQHFGVEEK